MTILKWIWRLIKTAKTLIIVTLLLLSLTLNIAQFTGGIISGIASTAFHAVTGKRSVAAQHAITVASMNKQLDAEKKANRKLRKKLANPNTRIVRYKGKRMSLNEAVETTSDSISQRAKRTAKREIGSMAGEALPWIGTAVIVGVTALEIKDLCDTLKDINAFKAAFNPNSKSNEEEKTVCEMKVPSKKELIEAAKNSPQAVWSATKGALAVAKANTPTVDDTQDYKLPNIDWGEYLDKSTEMVGEWKDGAIQSSKGVWSWWTTDEGGKVEED